MQDDLRRSQSQGPWSRRWLFFASTFVVCCTAGMAYTFLRPAVYRSTATLTVSRRTTSSVKNPNQGAAEQGLSLVAVQRHVVSDPAIIAQVFDRFAEHLKSEEFKRPDGTVSDFAEVEEMLSAHAVPETNLLELRAEGGRPTELTFLVVTWIDVYLAGHTAAEQKTTASHSSAIHAQLSELKGRVEAKRGELAAFRDTHNIASMQREENRVLARLNGLTRSLANAEEAEAGAAARVDAVKEALDAGHPVSSEETDQLLAEMETRATAAREWLRQREAVYAAEHLAKDKQVAETRAFIDYLVGAIGDRRTELERRELSNAELELATARKTVARIRGELTKQERTASEFTTRFAEHEALNEDLGQLHDLHRQLRERVVQTEVMRYALPPELSVARHASVPERPIRPNYSRDALLSLVGSLLCGLAAVMIDWVATRPPRQSTPLQTLESRTVYYPLVDSQVTGGQAAPAGGNIVDATAGSFSTRALEHRPPRELSSDEVTALLDVSEPATRSLLGLLLSGLSIDELRALNWSDFELAAGAARVSGADARSVTLAPAVVEYLEKYAAARGDTEGLLCRNASSKPLTREAINSLLVSTAHLAELENPAHVDAETLRHTYLAFLVRQGVPLAELEKMVGRIPEQALKKYELLQVPGRRVTAADADLRYPSLTSTPPV
jgi:succinoglycan biosynthesis transport protein ExoP